MKNKCVIGLLTFSLSLAGVSTFDFVNVSANESEMITQTVSWEEKVRNYRKAAVELDAEEAYLLAKMAMAEAEGEDTKGKALVIRVVLNRVWSNIFPDSVSEVIYQKKQFTSIANGRFDKVEPNVDCWKALELVLVEYWDESQGALYFEQTTDKATWHRKNLKELFVHGNHTFYRE